MDFPQTEHDQLVIVVTYSLTEKGKIMDQSSLMINPQILDADIKFTGFVGKNQANYIATRSKNLDQGKICSLIREVFVENANCGFTNKNIEIKIMA